MIFRILIRTLLIICYKIITLNHKKNYKFNNYYNDKNRKNNYENKYQIKQNDKPTILKIFAFYELIY